MLIVFNIVASIECCKGQQIKLNYNCVCSIICCDRRKNGMADILPPASGRLNEIILVQEKVLGFDWRKK